MTRAQQTLSMDMDMDMDINIDLDLDSETSTGIPKSGGRLEPLETNNLRLYPMSRTNQSKEAAGLSRNKLTRSAGTFNLMVNTVDSDKENDLPLGGATGNNIFNDNFTGHKILARNSVITPLFD